MYMINVKKWVNKFVHYVSSVGMLCKSSSNFVLLLLEKCKNSNLKYVAITNETKMISITEKTY